MCVHVHLYTLACHTHGLVQTQHVSVRTGKNMAAHLPPRILVEVMDTVHWTLFGLM